jgi:hypothetical protein
MIPVPMVVATAVPDMTPMRLNTDAMARSARGERERLPAVYDFGSEHEEENRYQFEVHGLAGRRIGCSFLPPL